LFGLHQFLEGKIITFFQAFNQFLFGQSDDSNEY
jgi:TM2 domain-containing membrane protein YozV